MARNNYPICSECGDEINPNRYEDCEQLFIVGDDGLCKSCFLQWLKDEWLDGDLEGLATAIGVRTVELR